jgi:hypothetical protein
MLASPGLVHENTHLRRENTSTGTALTAGGPAGSKSPGIQRAGSYKECREFFCKMHSDNNSVGIGGFFTGIEADHSPPHTADVKNEWSYTSTPL